MEHWLRFAPSFCTLPCMHFPRLLAVSWVLNPQMPVSPPCVSSFTFDCGHSHLEVFLPSLQGPYLLLHTCLLMSLSVLGFSPRGCPVPWVLPRLALPASRVQVHAAGWPLSFALESAYSSAPWKSLLGSSTHLKDVISRRAHLPHPAFLRCAPVSLLVEGKILHLVSQVGIYCLSSVVSWVSVCLSVLPALGRRLLWSGQWPYRPPAL